MTKQIFDLNQEPRIYNSFQNKETKELVRATEVSGYFIVNYGHFWTTIKKEIFLKQYKAND